LETDDESKNPIVDLPKPLPQEIQKPRPQISREKASQLTPFKFHDFAKNFYQENKARKSTNCLKMEDVHLLN
jgi:hypothetical protein